MSSTEPFFFTWSAQASARGVEIVGGEGAWFDTSDGARWLDLGSLTYHVNAGHGRRRVVEAIKAQADRLCVAMPKSVYPEKRRLAEKLLSIAGPAFEGGKVFFTLGGAEANENAMKIARLVTGRFKTISRWRSYHGASMGALSLTGDYRRPPFEPLVPGAIKVRDCNCGAEAPVVTEAPCPDAAALRHALLAEGDVGAVFLEPVPGANGVLVPRDDYWRRAREACDEAGALLVADEVLTGFGRCGRWLAHQRWGVTPDLITLSKGLTSGYGVLGAVLVHPRVAARFEDTPLLAGLTQYAHPLGVAAALEAIAIYEEEDLCARADTLGPRLLEGMAALPRVTAARGLGLLACAELDLDAAGWAALSAGLAREHVHAFVRPSERTLIVAPPLCVTDADLDEGLARLARAIPAA